MKPRHYGDVWVIEPEDEVPPAHEPETEEIEIILVEDIPEDTKPRIIIDLTGPF